MIRRLASPLQWSFAVLLSIMLWVLSIEEEPFEISRELPIAPPSLPSEFIVLGDLQSDSVSVSFNGQGIEVFADQLLREPRAVRINLAVSDRSDEFPLSISRDLSGDDIMFDGGHYSALTAASFSPSSITFTIDRTTVLDLPVSITTSTEIPERYYWRIVSQDWVEIKGAESVLEGMDSLHTCPVNPDSGRVTAAIVKPEGVIYISPSSITAELVPPSGVISQLN